ncbi:MAG: SMP-30/gluconolactonase/LRE family protein [Bryobacteraceae bacterium]
MRVRLAILALFAAYAGAQDFSNIKVEKIATDLAFAEGPAWSPEGFLLFSDTVTNKLYKFVGGKTASESGEVAGGPNGNAYDTQGRLYTCEFRQRRVTRTAKNGKVEVLASRFEGKRLNAPNDIVVRRDGHVYFTDPAFGNQEDSRELDFYGIFHITPKGELELTAKWKTRPNGITLAPNGRILYVADSDARCVRAFDLDRAGAASNERVIIDKIPGVPDGIRTDEKGNLYVAAKNVYVYSPQAQLLGDITLAETPSNVAFGDADLESLFITARTSVYRVRIGVKGALQY